MGGRSRVITTPASTRCEAQLYTSVTTAQTSFLIRTGDKMSRASKVFFGSAVAFMGATIYGVHWMQQRESDVSLRLPSGSSCDRGEPISTWLSKPVELSCS